MTIENAMLKYKKSCRECSRSRFTQLTEKQVEILLQKLLDDPHTSKFLEILPFLLFRVKFNKYINYLIKQILIDEFHNANIEYTDKIKIINTNENNHTPRIIKVRRKKKNDNIKNNSNILLLEFKDDIKKDESNIDKNKEEKIKESTIETSIKKKRGRPKKIKIENTKINNN